MIALAILMVGIGLADVVSGPAGRPESRTRAWMGIAVGSFSGGLLAWGSGFDGNAIALLTLACVAGIGGWVIARVPESTWTPKWAVPALVVFVSQFAVMVAISSRWPSPATGLLQRLVRSVDVPALNVQPYSRVLLISGILTMLAATGNAIVRLSLAALGTPVSVGESSLRGGRLIGPLERLLIFGLALAGEPTAAALVISAKGLLRFPELNDLRDREPAEDGSREPGRRRIDEVTEYLLVGSLVSWVVALAPLVFVA